MQRVSNLFKSLRILGAACALLASVSAGASGLDLVGGNPFGFDAVRIPAGFEVPFDHPETKRRQLGKALEQRRFSASVFSGFFFARFFFCAKY